MPFSLSSLTGSKKIETQVEGNSTEIEKTTTESVEVTGTVNGTAERKFEWNLGRLFNSQEGHSQARTWAVRVLSVIFVLPTVLTAIVDLGRGLGFLAGNKSETLGKIFTGKSFSLIDGISTAGQSAANKVNSVYKSVTTPRVLTIEELNEKSEKAIKSQVNKLIDGYKALNGGYFHTNSSFSSPAALKGEKQIASAQKEIVKMVGEYLGRNVSKTEDFKDVANDLGEKIVGFITAAAKDDVFVANKVVRSGPQPLLKDIAIAELSRLDANVRVVSNQFISLAKQEPIHTVAKSLKLGVNQEIITPEEAKQAIVEHASAVFAESLASGLEVANMAEAILLNSAVKNNILTTEEVSSMEDTIRPTVEQLAMAAAIDVAKQMTPKTTEEIVLAQLTKAADQLIESKKLDPKDKSEFFVLAQGQIEAVRDRVIAERSRNEADSQIQKMAQEQAELIVRQEADVAEAQRAAEVKRAEDQVSLLGKFKDILSVIAKKQAELDTQFIVRDKLDAERQTVTNDLAEIKGTQVIIKNKLMTVLDAVPIYYTEKSRISNSKSLTDKQKEELGRALATQGFDKKTIEMINQLAPLDKQIDEKIAEMAVVSEKIENQHKELTHFIGVYNVYEKNNKNLLDDTNRKEVKGLKKQVFESQNDLNTRRNKLLHLGVIAQLRPHVSIVNPDAAANTAEVDAIIEADKMAQSSSEEASLPQPPGGILNTLYNFPGAVKRRIWG